MFCLYTAVMQREAQIKTVLAINLVTHRLVVDGELNRWEVGNWLWSYFTVYQNMVKSGYGTLSIGAILIFYRGALIWLTGCSSEKLRVS